MAVSLLATVLGQERIAPIKVLGAIAVISGVILTKMAGEPEAWVPPVEA